MHGPNNLVINLLLVVLNYDALVQANETSQYYKIFMAIITMKIFIVCGCVT